MGTLLALATLTGCVAATPGGVRAQSADERDASVSGFENYVCGADSFPAAVFADPKRIADLDETGQTAISTATHDDGAPVELDDLESWGVLIRNGATIVLLRPNATSLGEHLRLPGSASNEPDYEELTLIYVASEGGWKFASNGRCRLTFAREGLEVPELALDPAYPMVADARELHLLVQDPQCGGDTDMPQRIEARVDERAGEVRLSVAVQPLPPGAYRCPAFPPTGYTVKLEAPLGDRTVVDASRVNRYELRPAGSPSP
ncbi:MAG: hypothetical protein J0H64_09315 [Actinobacteria bacterium]|nr:hypothetical protein [Actinomycetota bacterium]